jgi:hypothetical protein
LNEKPIEVVMELDEEGELIVDDEVLLLLNRIYMSV